MPTLLKWFLVVLVMCGAAAGRADEPKPAWRELPDAWPTRLIISDPLPHLRRVLRSETLRKTLTEGTLAQFLEDSQQRLADSEAQRRSRLAEWVSRMGDVRETLDPRHWLSAIEGRAAFIPEEIVLAAPDAAGPAVGDWFQAVLLLQLAPAAVRLNDRPSDLQDAVIRLLRRAELPRLNLRVRFRDPALPHLAFAQAQAMARQLAAAGWTTTIEDRALGIQQRLGLLYQDDSLRSIIIALGFASEGDDKLAAMTEAAGKLEFEFWLEIADNDLVVTVGERLKNQKLVGKQLGSLWSGDADRVLFAAWRFAGFKQRIRESQALLQRYADSPAGKAAAEADENDFLGMLRRMDARLAHIADSGSASLTFGDSLVLRTITQGAAPAPALSGSPLMRLVPKDVEHVSLSADDSLGGFLAAMFDKFEDRMETRSLQYDLTGKDQMAVQLQKLRRFYYGEMQDVRRLVFDEASKVFEPPLASLLASSGHIDRLKVSLRSTGGVPQTIELHNDRLTVFDVLETGAVPQTIELHNVPSPEYAVISAARDTDAAMHFIADLTGRLRGRLRGEPADDDEKFEPRPMDVGLGVPTFGFGPLGSTSTGSDGREEGWRIEAEGDVLPHYFAHDRFVVVSSSVRLSKAILAAGRGEANRLKLPPVASGELIAYGRSPGSLFARLLEQVGSWSAALADEKKATIKGDLFENLRPTHESSRALSRFLVGLAEIIRLVDGAEWRTSQSAQGCTSRMVISPRE